MRSVLEDAYVELVLLLRKGKSSSEQGMREVLEVSGVAAIATEHLPGKPPIVSALPIRDILGVAREMSLGGIVRRVARASHAQLEQARDDALALRAFARVFAPFTIKVFGVREAFGFAAIAATNDLAVAYALPGMLLLRALFPSEFIEFRALIDRETPRFCAYIQLLERIPECYRRYLGSRSWSAPWERRSAPISRLCSIASRPRSHLRISWRADWRRDRPHGRRIAGTEGWIRIRRASASRRRSSLEVDRAPAVAERG
ncbi:MAG: hypothetical protein M3065_04380 [Actinomycetota bacterium]|nr:hypothetical protein [Actinomycetota bacterium]